MMRLCLDGHITGYRQCPQCGKSTKPEVGLGLGRVLMSKHERRVATREREHAKQAAALARLTPPRAWKRYRVTRSLASCDAGTWQKVVRTLRHALRHGLGL